MQYLCVVLRERMCKTEPAEPPEMILSWSCCCQLMETHHVEKFHPFSIANLDSTRSAVTLITRQGSNANKHPGWISSSFSYLQGKSFSLLHRAMQFSRVGRRPLFFACWSMAYPSTDSKVHALLQVLVGRHIFCM